MGGCSRVQNESIDCPRGRVLL